MGKNDPYECRVSWGTCPAASAISETAEKHRCGEWVFPGVHHEHICQFCNRPK